MYLPPPPPANPIPHLIEVLDTAVRVDLENLRFAYFVKLLIFTGLVFTGLVFEAGEISHDVIGFFRRRKIEWGYEAAPALIRKHREPSHRVKMFAAVGWLLIVTGVGGEGVFEGFVSWADSTLQPFNETLLTESRRASSSANERAAMAFGRAAQTEIEAAEDLKTTNVARQRAEEARKQAEGFQLQIAQANERAANSEKEAAASRLETEKLKQAVAWRSFSRQTASALEKPLSAKPGAVNLRYVDGDPESLFLAWQFLQILRRAKWDVAISPRRLSHFMLFGIALPDANGKDANTLRTAFSQAGIPYSTDPIPPAEIELDLQQIPGAPTLMIGSKLPVGLP